MLGVFGSLKQLFNKNIVNGLKPEQEIIPKIFLIIGVVLLFMFQNLPHWLFQEINAQYYVFWFSWLRLKMKSCYNFPGFNKLLMNVIH